MGMFRNSNSFIISRLTIFHQLLRTSVSWTMALKSRLQSLPNKRKISGNSLFFPGNLTSQTAYRLGVCPELNAFLGLSISCLTSDEFFLMGRGCNGRIVEGSVMAIANLRCITRSSIYQLWYQYFSGARVVSLCAPVGIES